MQFIKHPHMRNLIHAIVNDSTTVFQFWYEMNCLDAAVLQYWPFGRQSHLKKLKYSFPVKFIVWSNNEILFMPWVQRQFDSVSDKMTIHARYYISVRGQFRRYTRVWFNCCHTIWNDYSSYQLNIHLITLWKLFNQPRSTLLFRPYISHYILLSVSRKFADDRIRTEDLCFWEWPLCQVHFKVLWIRVSIICSCWCWFLQLFWNPKPKEWNEKFN